MKIMKYKGMDFYDFLCYLSEIYDEKDNYGIYRPKFFKDNNIPYALLIHDTKRVDFVFMPDENVNWYYMETIGLKFYLDYDSMMYYVGIYEVDDRGVYYDYIPNVSLYVRYKLLDAIKFVTDIPGMDLKYIRMMKYCVQLIGSMLEHDYE